MTKETCDWPVHYVSHAGPSSWKRWRAAEENSFATNPPHVEMESVAMRGFVFAVAENPIREPWLKQLLAMLCSRPLRVPYD